MTTRTNDQRNLPPIIGQAMNQYEEMGVSVLEIEADVLNHLLMTIKSLNLPLTGAYNKAISFGGRLLMDAVEQEIKVVYLDGVHAAILRQCFVDIVRYKDAYNRQQSGSDRPFLVGGMGFSA